MGNEPESPALEETKIDGEMIDNITFGKEGITIYLKDGRYTSYNTAIDISKFGIKPIFSVDCGYWGRMDEEK